MAGLIERNGIYYAIFSVEGKQRRKTTKIPVRRGPGTGDMTARQLRALAMQTAEAMEMAEKGNFAALNAAISALAAMTPGKTVPTVAAWFAEYEERARRKGLKNVPNSLRSFLRLMPGVEKIALDKVTAAMAEDWVERALGEVSGSTVDRRLADLSAVFNRAVREEILTKNPFRGIRVPKWSIQPHEREPFSPEDLARIFSEFPGEWPDMVAVCLLLGGQRLGDTAQLRWEQISEDGSIISLKTEKTSRRMMKPVVAPLRKIFERRRAAQGTTSPYIFPYAGMRVECSGGQTSKLSLEFSELCRKSGISKKMPSPADGSKVHHMTDKTFHSLRSTATTFLLDLGTPAEMVRFIVGHDDPEIERRHYLKPSAEMVSKYMGVLAEKLGL